MVKLSHRRLIALAAAFVFAAIGFIAQPAKAQQKPVIKVSSLTLPVFNPLVWNIMATNTISKPANAPLIEISS